MIWVSIALAILQLVKALPGIIDTVEQILAKLRGHPLAAQHGQALLDILHAHQAGAETIVTASALHALHAQL